MYKYDNMMVVDNRGVGGCHTNLQNVRNIWMIPYFCQLDGLDKGSPDLFEDYWGQKLTFLKISGAF